jgi:hypothetical protein
MPENIKDNISITAELRNIYEEIDDILENNRTQLKGLYTLTSDVYEENKKIVETQKKAFIQTKAWYSVEEQIRKNQEKQKDLREELKELVDAELATEANVAAIMAEVNALVAARLGLDAKKNRNAAIGNVLSTIGLENLHKSYTSISSTLSQGLKLSTVWALIGKWLAFSVGVFDKIDKQAADFRKTMGITRTYTSEIDKSARAVAFNLAHVGATAKDAYDSFIGIANSLGSAYYATKEMSTDMALMQAQLGIAAGTSAEFLQTMGMVGRTTADAQKDMALFTAQLSEAAGTNLTKVMGDVANAAKSGYVFLSRDPAALAKAAVQARLLGTSLDKITSSAESLVDFTHSVEAEMEASVLAGEGINLQRARELAYNRDIKGLNEEILKLAKQHRYEQMDPFQQKSFAKAVGVSADEMGRMVQSQRERANMEAEIMARGPPAEKARLQRLKDMERASANIVKDEAALARKQLSTLANQSRIAAITNSWQAITQRLAEVILPVVDVVLGAIAYTLGVLNKSWVAWVGVAVMGLTTVIGLGWGFYKLIGRLGMAFGRAIGTGIASALQGAAVGLQALGAAGANPITWIGIAALLALGAAFVMVAYGINLILKALPQAAQGFSIFAEAITKMGWNDIAKMAAMVPVLYALAPALVAFAVGAAAGGGAMGLLARGFSAIGSGLASLVNPNLGGAIGQINLMAEAVRNLNTALDDIPIIKMAAIQITSAMGMPVANARQTGDDAVISTLNRGFEMLGGKIDRIQNPVMKVDGQLLTSTLARQTEFTNGYGVNNAKLAMG